MKIDVQIKVLDERLRGRLPVAASPMAAGLDVLACIDEPIKLAPQDKAVLIPLGFSIYIGDPNYAAVLMPRSGMGHKKGLVLGNTIGLIDADYQGPMFASAWNRNRPAMTMKEFHEGFITIEPFERIAQLVFLPIARPRFTEVEEFTTATVRGEGGFGSTGSK